MEEDISTLKLNWHNCLWSCNINLSLATGILFYFHIWKFYHLYLFPSCGVFVVCLGFFPWGMIPPIWCQQEVLREISYINPWPMYWKMEHGTMTAIPGIHCGRLAWSLHNFQCQAFEEIHSVFHSDISALDSTTECCLNPKSNAINKTQLWKTKKGRKEA